MERAHRSPGSPRFFLHRFRLFITLSLSLERSANQLSSAHRTKGLSLTGGEGRLWEQDLVDDLDYAVARPHVALDDGGVAAAAQHGLGIGTGHADGEPKGIVGVLDLLRGNVLSGKELLKRSVGGREDGDLLGHVVEGAGEVGGLEGGHQGREVWHSRCGLDQGGGGAGVDASIDALVVLAGRGLSGGLSGGRVDSDLIARWHLLHGGVADGWHRQGWHLLRGGVWRSIELQETPPSAPAKGIDGGLGEHHSIDALHDALAGVHVAIHDGGVAVGGHNGGPVVAHQAGSLQSGQADAVHKHVSGVRLSHNVVLEDVSQQRRSQQVLGGQAKGGECGIESIIRWREDGHLGGGVIEGILQASGLDGGHQGGEVWAVVGGVDESGGDVGLDAVRAALVEVGSTVRLGGVGGSWHHIGRGVGGWHLVSGGVGGWHRWHHIGRGVVDGWHRQGWHLLGGGVWRSIELQETPPSAPAKGIDGGLGEHHSVDDLHDALAGIHVAIHDGGVAVGGHNGGSVVAHQAGSLQGGQADAVHKHLSGVRLSHNVVLEDV